MLSTCFHSSTVCTHSHRPSVSQNHTQTCSKITYHALSLQPPHRRLWQLQFRKESLLTACCSDDLSIGLYSEAAEAEVSLDPQTAQIHGIRLIQGCLHAEESKLNVERGLAACGAGQMHHNLLPNATAFNRCERCLRTWQ